jgi:hypothetical protein
MRIAWLGSITSGGAVVHQRFDDTAVLDWRSIAALVQQAFVVRVLQAGFETQATGPVAADPAK